MRYAREIWVQIIRQYEASGLTQEEYAQQRGIPVGTLRCWIYKLRREQQDAPLLPVRVVASPAPTARQPEAEDGAVELLVGESLVLRFPPGATPSLIAEVVALLRA